MSAIDLLNVSKTFEGRGQTGPELFFVGMIVAGVSLLDNVYYFSMSLIL